MGGNNWEGGTPEVASDDQVIGRSSGFFHAGKVLRDFCQNIHPAMEKIWGKWILQGKGSVFCVTRAAGGLDNMVTIDP